MLHSIAHPSPGDDPPFPSLSGGQTALPYVGGDSSALPWIEAESATKSIVLYRVDCTFAALRPASRRGNTVISVRPMFG